MKFTLGWPIATVAFFTTSSVGLAEIPIDATLTCSALTNGRVERGPFMSALPFSLSGNTLKGERKPGDRRPGEESYVGTINSNKTITVTGRGAFFDGSRPTWHYRFSGLINNESLTSIKGSLETNRGEHRDCSITFLLPPAKWAAALAPPVTIQSKSQSASQRPSASDASGPDAPPKEDNQSKKPISETAPSQSAQAAPEKQRLEASAALKPPPRNSDEEHRLNPAPSPSVQQESTAYRENDNQLNPQPPTRLPVAPKSNTQTAQIKPPVGIVPVTPPNQDPIDEAIHREQKATKVPVPAATTSSTSTPTALADRPSFSCANVRNNVARIICAGREGASADWSLNSTLWAIAGLKSPSEQIMFDQEQQRWRTALSKLCASFPDSIPSFSAEQINCVVDAFARRTSLLQKTLPPDALNESRLSPDQHADIQQLLIDKGLLKSKPDGEFGDVTRQAIRRLQESEGSEPTGFLSAAQLSQIQNDKRNQLSTEQSPPSSQSSQRPLSQTELSEFRKRIYPLWKANLGTAILDDLSFSVRIKLGADGRLLSSPETTSPSSSASYSFASKAAIEAITKAQPFNMFQPESYDSWKDMIVVFDTRDIRQLAARQAAVADGSFPFSLSDIYKIEPPTIMGNLSSSEDICERLGHPFFSHPVSYYSSFDWDPSQLGTQWIRERLRSAPPIRTLTEISPGTQQGANANLRECLRQIEKNTPQRLRAIALLLGMPDISGNERRTCYSADTSSTEQRITQSGEIIKTQRTTPPQSCITLQNISINATFSGPGELSLFLTLKEAGPALHSILDAAEDRMSNVAAADAAVRKSGNEYAEKAETQWELVSKFEEMKGAKVSTAISNQRNDSGVVAEVTVRCSNQQLKMTALIVDEAGKPTIGLPTTDDFLGQPAIRGQIRINDGAAENAFFYRQNNFRNQFGIEGALDRNKLLGNARYWKVAVSVQTTSQPIIIKIPMFQREIQSVIESCQ